MFVAVLGDNVTFVALPGVQVLLAVSKPDPDVAVIEEVPLLVEVNENVARPLVVVDDPLFGVSAPVPVAVKLTVVPFATRFPYWSWTVAVTV